ncbi:hypothetical protein BT96DRAFT_976979 [Gymnopus androsaceus JB14]|uniref:Uncharacterized protein n=1 Tax=Gymnopus androsaceus JB14 TaxID=1447944 RepID=A0A6A4HK01_9AGAR|nr:hypothetical protein BT96DRAFT_976979 [Gymnopus androsaceus JB14]
MAQSHSKMQTSLGLGNGAYNIFSWILTNYDCCKSLVLALNSGLLEALWRLSQVVVQNSCPPGTDSDFSFQELFGSLVGIIATASLYRSVQKPLERLLNKSPLNEISERIADTSNHKDTEVQRIWGRFRTIVENRIQLRYRWEVSSFTGNETFPVLLAVWWLPIVAVCAKNLTGFKNTAKSVFCMTIAGKHPSGFWVNVEERDLEILDNIIHTELWHIRSELLQQQCDHLKSPGVHDSQASTTLFNFIDFTSPDQELEKKIWTRFEAERNTPSFNWDLTIQSFKKTEQENGSRVGPYVIVKIPYLGGRMMLHPLILTKPDVRIDSGDSEDDDEDENTNSNTEPLDFDLD